MVRDILKEALAARGISTLGADASTVPQPVQITSNDELQAFVAHLARPGVIKSVRSGTLCFVLAEAHTAPEPLEAAPVTQTLTLDGVISERRMQSVPKGAVVQLASGAILTPLAQDVARRLGLTVRRHDG